jgi:hypothetical protein
MRTKRSDGGSQVYRKCPDVLGRMNRLGEVAVLHFGQGERYFKIDGLAAEVWTLIDGSTDLGEIKSTLHGKYEISPSFLNRSLTRFISKLQRLELIEPL